MPGFIEIHVLLSSLPKELGTPSDCDSPWGLPSTYAVLSAVTRMFVTAGPTWIVCRPDCEAESLLKIPLWDPVLLVVTTRALPLAFAAPRAVLRICFAGRLAKAPA